MRNGSLCLFICVFIGFVQYGFFAPKTYRYLALGDSYTIGTAIGQENSYAQFIADSLQKYMPKKQVQRTTIAKNGWTTADLLAGIAKENPKGPFEFVTLLIGVNNQYQHKSKENYQTEFATLLSQSIDLAGNKPSHVLVISIPDYGVCPVAEKNREAIAKEIDAFNAINKEISTRMGVTYVEITEISRKAFHQPTYVAADQLHFSAKMHALWMQNIKPHLPLD